MSQQKDESQLKAEAKEILTEQSDLLNQQIPDQIVCGQKSDYAIAVEKIIDVEDQGLTLDNQLKSHYKKSHK